MVRGKWGWGLGGGGQNGGKSICNAVKNKVFKKENNCLGVSGHSISRFYFRWMTSLTSDHGYRGTTKVGRSHRWIAVNSETWKISLLLSTIFRRKEESFAWVGEERLCNSISLIMRSIKELLFPFLCSFRETAGRLTEKETSDWATRCDSKVRQSVSFPEECLRWVEYFYCSASMKLGNLNRNVPDWVHWTKNG